MNASTEVDIKQSINEAYERLGKLRMLLLLMESSDLKNEQLTAIVEQIKEQIFSNEGRILALVGPSQIEQCEKIIQARDPKFRKFVDGYS